MKPVLITEDFTKNFQEVIERFKNDIVLVGVPETESSREKDSGDEQGNPVNNATILAIAEFGSPANNIPSRPVLTTGIRLAQGPIADIFKNGAKRALSKGVSEIRNTYERAGNAAAQSVKKVINNQIDVEPPAASTIALRKARGFKGTKALLVTGQLRNSITYVVNSGKN